ncbi:MAG TPA: hypothetical protein VII73_05930 [Caulobacteraceae bacterium]
MFFPTLALAQAPQNFAPNSQWEVISTVGYAPRENSEGTGPLPPVAITANTTGSNLVVLSVSGPTGEAKAGDLIVLSGAGADRALTLAPMRITALKRDAEITVRAPLGLAPRVSRPASARNVNIGGEASAGTGDGPDGWTKSTSLVFWREDNAANVPPGAYYSLGLSRRASPAEFLVTHPNPHLVRGRTIAFGAYVLHRPRNGSAAWRVVISSDGSGGYTAMSPAALPSTDYQWRELRYTVPADATAVYEGVELEGGRGDTFYLANPVATIGRAIGEGGYLKPFEETLIPVVKITPYSWDNATITFPATPDAGPSYAIAFDAYAETGGAIAPTVARIDTALEGINDEPVIVGGASVRAIAFRDKAGAPIKYSPIMAQTVAGVKTFGGGPVVLDGDGRAVAYSGVAADRWRNVSLDISGFLLK